jgi:hypothetical protein
MQAPIEIRYAGVVVGRVQEVSTSDGDASSYFLPLREPMPVGSVVRLRSGDQETPARVVRAVEAAEAAGSGMHVRLIGDAEVVAPEWIPPPAAIAPVKPKPPAPEPIVDTGKARSREIAPSVSPQEPKTNGDAAAEAGQAAVQADLAQTSAARADTAQADARDIDKPVAAASETPASDAKLPATRAEAEASSLPATNAENTSKEIAAIPEEVPVAVGSSMTGALENATETAPYGTAVRSHDNAAAARAIPEDSGSAPASGEQLSFEEPPPARPVASPSGRRRTKRRK